MNRISTEPLFSSPIVCLRASPSGLAAGHRRNLHRLFCSAHLGADETTGARGAVFQSIVATCFPTPACPPTSVSAQYPE